MGDSIIKKHSLGLDYHKAFNRILTENGFGPQMQGKIIDWDNLDNSLRLHYRTEMETEFEERLDKLVEAGFKERLDEMGVDPAAGDLKNQIEKVLGKKPRSNSANKKTSKKKSSKKTKSKKDNEAGGGESSAE